MSQNTRIAELLRRQCKIEVFSFGERVCVHIIDNGRGDVSCGYGPNFTGAFSGAFSNWQKRERPGRV